jgi:hypothetical protein
MVTVAVPDIGEPTTGGTSLAPVSVSVCVFDIPPIVPICVLQAPKTAAPATIAIPAINLRLPSCALIAFLRGNGSCDLAGAGDAATA